MTYLHDRRSLGTGGRAFAVVGASGRDSGAGRWDFRQNF